MTKKTCESCHKEFDYEYDMNSFYYNTGLEQNGLRKTLCYDCACEAINDGIEDVYFATCTRCNKTFDLAKEDGDFIYYHDGLHLQDFWNSKETLCGECADDKNREIIEEYNTLEDDEDDESIPAGCAACGDPTYPDCRSSCPMFDDK